VQKQKESGTWIVYDVDDGEVFWHGESHLYDDNSSSSGKFFTMAKKYKPKGTWACTDIKNAITTVLEYHKVEANK